MSMPDFLTRTLCAKLQFNWRAGVRADKAEEDFDPKPVCMLEADWAGVTYLLTEQDPDNPDTVFGLRINAGSNVVEIAEFSLTEMASLEGPDGERLERNMDFVPTQTLEQEYNKAIENAA